jgi:hypothetical protein
LGVCRILSSLFFRGKLFRRTYHWLGWKKQGWWQNAMLRIGRGGMELPVLASSSGLWVGKLKGSGMKRRVSLSAIEWMEALLRG